MPVVWWNESTKKYCIKGKIDIEEAPRQIQDKLNRIFCIKRTGD